MHSSRFCALSLSQRPLRSGAWRRQADSFKAASILLREFAIHEASSIHVDVPWSISSSV